MELNPGVLKEKEIEEAKAVLEKHGLLKAIDNQNRSDIVILFGEKAGSSSGSSESSGGNKKREAKAADKDDIKSVRTTKSGKHKTVRCDLCSKEMRSDNFKAHRGSKYCKQATSL